MRKVLTLIICICAGTLSYAQTTLLTIENTTSCPIEVAIAHAEYKGCDVDVSTTFTIPGGGTMNFTPPPSGYEYFFVTIQPMGSITTYLVQNPIAALTLNSSFCENISLSTSWYTAMYGNNCAFGAQWTSINLSHGLVTIF